MADSPSEELISRKFDSCIEGMFKSAGMGLAGGAVFGFLLFRNNSARAAFAVAPAAFLAGTKWSECARSFKAPLVPGKLVSDPSSFSKSLAAMKGSAEGCPVNHKSKSS